MEIFRITKPKYADSLKASGNEARWNHKGEDVIYAASSRALASLELIVHLSGFILKNPYKINVIGVPNDLLVININKEEMPRNWGSLSPYKETQRLGSAWLKSKNSSVLKVPSSIVINGYNYVINTNHTDFDKLDIVDTEDYLFDPRIIDKMK